MNVFLQYIYFMDSSLEHLSKEELIDQYEQLQTSKDQLQSDKDHLQYHYDQLRRLVFGTKRERFIKANNPHQQSLPFEEQPIEDTQLVKEEVSYQRNKRSKRENHPGRNALPKHLPVEQVVIEPKIDISQMICIGQEISERLELIPAKLFIQRSIRPKYALPKAEPNEDVKSIVIANLPYWAIEKSIAGNSLLASIFVDKFVDHLPFYRQISRFKREQIDIRSSSIDGWQTKLTILLEPLYDCLNGQQEKR
ncbi:MAG: transposase [Flavobacteriales bacterium]|nr:transposase [Flavobacteriales bacterium]